MAWNIANILIEAQKKSGGGGTGNYPDLTNKPSINNVTLSGDKSSSDLGLADADDIPGLATDSAPGIVQPDGTTITIDGGVISAVGGGGGGSHYSTTETLTGDTWIDNKPIYRKVVPINNLPNAAANNYPSGVSNVSLIKIFGIASFSTYQIPLPFVSVGTGNVRLSFNTNDGNIEITTDSDRSNWRGYVIIEYTKNS